MISFFHDGSQIGISIGIYGVLLVSYIIMEVTVIIATKISLIRKSIIYFRVYLQLKKILPKWWKIKKINYFTISKSDLNPHICDCFITIKSIYNDISNSSIKVSKLGKLSDITSLQSSIKYYDRLNEDKIKQFKRNNILENIGI